MVKILCNLIPFDLNAHHITILYKRIGANVRKIRKQKGVSQLDLALAVGYKSVSSIAKAESLIENKHFNIEQLYKISKALGVPIERFFEGI